MTRGMACCSRESECGPRFCSKQSFMLNQGRALPRGRSIMGAMVGEEKHEIGRITPSWVSRQEKALRRQAVVAQLSWRTRDAEQGMQKGTMRHERGESRWYGFYSAPGIQLYFHSALESWRFFFKTLLLRLLRSECYAWGRKELPALIRQGRGELSCDFRYATARRAAKGEFGFVASEIWFEIAGIRCDKTVR